MRSIEKSLLAWVMGALILGSMLVALVTYLVTLEEMNEVFDASLKNVAEALASYHHSGPGFVPDGSLSWPARSDEPEDSEIVTLTWSPTGERVYASDPRVHVAFTSVEGLARPVIDGEEWIVYSSVHDDGVAQAAQRQASRREMARESATKLVPPMVVLALAVGGLLVYGLRRGLRPLDHAARDVAVRSANTLAPIPEGDVPREMQPLVGSINGLLSRLAATFSAQRRFMADAAHELRTPATALRLQLQLLERTRDDAERSGAMAELRAGIERMTRLIEQLLQVSRAEHDGAETPFEPVDLATLVRSVVGHLSVQADHAGIDLGASGDRNIVIEGDEQQLVVLLNNLVGNAIRYTPPGGVVDVLAGRDGARATLRVIDDGPGIAEADRRRVFDRFYRGESSREAAGETNGSGLGLAIVKAIAERHGADVELRTPASGRGLEVCVSFEPTARAP